MSLSFRTRSFVLGVSLASITWLTILYLYVTLVQESSGSNGPTQYMDDKPVAHKLEMDKSNFKNSKYDSVNSPNAIHGEKTKQRTSYKDMKKYRRKKKPYQKSLYKSKTSLSDFPKQENFHLADLSLVRSVDDREMKEKGYREHAFNTLVSSRLSLHRDIPDTRHERCHSINYPKDLPSLSIIICFYREDISTLLRTVHSIFDRTPSATLKEVILVDDTDDEHYHAEVSKNLLPVSSKIILVKTTKREGLIRARVFGAHKATAEVLLFLDSHVEVNQGWAEPLLSRVAEDTTRVVTPIIDVISPDTFKYSSSTLVRGGFNWGLFFKWDSIPVSYFAKKENFVRPIRSATMAGGLFAIDRKYFKELGEYDTGMDVWGGENLELSFRIWMCGGTLEIIPCSRVGHIFRKRRPYGDFSGGDSLIRNSLRVASVWMDEYKEKFLEMQPEARTKPYGDISSRLQLRKDLKCKSFKWYLNNIYPEILNGTSIDGIPGKKFERWDQKQRNYLSEIRIRLSGSSLCVESEEDVSVRGGKLVLSECASLPRQTFAHTDKHELILSKLLCLQASNKMPRLSKCHEMGGDQEWRLNKQNGVALYNIAAGLCLAAVEERSGAYVHMSLCSSPLLAKWDIVDID